MDYGKFWEPSEDKNRFIDFCYECLERNYDSVDDIPRISADISYDTFFRDYMVKNLPCIIQSVTDNWPCTKSWVENDKPNINYLISKYKTSEVMVSNCSSVLQCKEKVTLEKYFSNYYRAADEIWYLKDWHLKRENSEDVFYTVPEHFASDWLNEYAVDNSLDDFMFVYIGPKGSWTGFHADVYYSFSWSANVIGKKRWLLFPPGEEKHFIDSFGNFPCDIEPLLNKKVKYFEIYQNPGEAIFVPSGWHHQVFNEEDTISINHNWVNGSNIDIMWSELVKNLIMVEEEIKEFKESADWKDHCQLMLKALFGINYADFIKFIQYIAKQRLLSCSDGADVSFQNWTFGKRQVLFDISAIQEVVKKMICDEHFSEDELLDLNELLKQILNVNRTLL